ncbi:hypothetical protein SteCoe_18872 [Stentor coeruleus]|uniref:RING-type domain-containing protein n=1 Tax=Stentor coeruleus TaxID=5963 RepID=A0A1R2BVQ7_9CILI|nr:hypothetical protein SteCoe_18872 [Stentor coeruleus]
MFEKLLSLIGVKRQREEPSELKKMRKHCRCPICTEPIVKCALTNCGHTFCEYCFEQSIIYSSSCPLCRKKLTRSSTIPCKSIDNYIYSQLSDKQKESYVLRMGLITKWNEEKKLSNTKVGMKIDALDTEGVWCSAVIRLKIDNGEKIPSLYIHYAGWDSSYDEIILENSYRLAPSGFYTSKNIPKYIMGSIVGINDTDD